MVSPSSASTTSECASDLFDLTLSWLLTIILQLIAAQQAFYKGLERAATRLAEAEERYGSSSSRREVPIKEVPIKEVPIKEPPKPREVPIARDRAASKSTSNLKVSIVNARKLKAADLNGTNVPERSPR